MRLLYIVALAGLLGGCGAPDQAPTAANTATPEDASASPQSRLPTDAWIGKWIGVEGLALGVARSTQPGTYVLTVSLLDGTAQYVGTAEGDSIVFVRDGHEEHIKKATGAQTGLKWLADKQDCLMIRPGEGFCRG